MRIACLVAEPLDPAAMTTLNKLFVLSMAMIVGACSTVAPVPVTVDTSVPAVVETDGLRATLRVLPREEGRLLLAFSTPHWAPGLWRLELPFNAGAGAAGPHLSIPLTFKASARPLG